MTPAPVTPVPELWTATEAVQGHVTAEAASVYDGFLADANGNVAGTVQVKVAKPKNGKAKAKVTIQPLGGKKTTVNGTLDLATGKVDGIGLTLGADGMSGTLNGYAASGSRNLFSSKNKTEQGAADAVLKPWLGAVNVAWEGAQGWNGLSVNIAKKGKVKVSGTLANGTKVLANGQLVVGAEWCCVPVVAAKAKLAFTLWLPMAQGVEPLVVGLGEDVKDGVVVSKVGNLSGTSYFHLVDTPTEIGGAKVIPELLPIDVAITPAGAKWNIAKAKAVKLDRSGNLSYGDNPSGLKLTYTKKTGMFKGSLFLYTMNNRRLKKNTVTISGIVVNGIGYGTATLKKVGCWSVIISTDKSEIDVDVLDARVESEK